MRADTRKAALWATLAALAQLGSAIVGPDTKSWHLTLTSVGFGLVLPMIAMVHLRQRAHRDSGATLATISGTATVTIGVAAAASAEIATAELFVRGIWWWVVGKIWWETAALGRLLGALTMALGLLCIAVVLASAPLGLELHRLWLPFRALMGVWLLAVAFDLLRGTMNR